MSKYAPRRREDTLEIIILIAAIIVGVTIFYLFVLNKKEPAQPNPTDESAAVAEPGNQTAPPESTTAPAPEPSPPEPTPRTRVEPPDPAPTVNGTPAPSVEIEDVDKLLNSGDMDDLMTARAAMTRILLNTDNPDERAAAKRRLDALNQRLFFSARPSPDSVMHTVQPGDSLWRIKNKYRSSVELIKQVNSLSTSTVRVGQTLKIPQGEFAAVVNRGAFRLIVLLDGHYIKQYPVGIGKGDLTPAGTFTVQVMAKNPQWTNPDNGQVIPHDDPRNPLGTRWIGFAPKDGRSGLGIHGTTEPETIGTKCSRGCVRMRNEDAEEVYGMLNRGDTVVIK